jgi:hypothetical protein
MKTTWYLHSQLWEVIPVHITAASQAVAPTSTALTASAAVIYPGQNVTLTATVTSSAGTPTGTVTFLNGSTQLSTGTLIENDVATNTGTLSPGANSLTADYASTTAFAASNSAAITVTEPGLLPEFEFVKRLRPVRQQPQRFSYHHAGWLIQPNRNHELQLSHGRRNLQLQPCQF